MFPPLLKSGLKERASFVSCTAGTCVNHALTLLGLGGGGDGDRVHLGNGGVHNRS